MGQDMIQQLHVPLPDFMQEELKPLPWEVERNSLIKKECHKYDEEWRMLSNCKMNLPAMIECVPAEVIIGLRTPPVDKNLIISMAKEAGSKISINPTSMKKQVERISAQGCIRVWIMQNTDDRPAANHPCFCYQII